MTDKPGSKGNNALQDEAISSAAGTNRLELEYPRIPLHLSLESLLVHSSSSGSPSRHAMSTFGQTPPALGDSWASLTDVESSTSNEEDLRSEHTDVGSLLDVHSSDDVHSATDGEESTNEEDVTSSAYLRRQSPLEAGIRQATSLDHSHIGVSELNFVGAESQETIRHATYRHTIVRPLTEIQNQQFRRWRDEDISSKVCSIIRMPLLENGLDLDSLDYFKVILLGRHVEQFKPEIQRKLGDALVSRRVSSGSASRTSISRFHLVPSSFGPGSQPEFADLVAIDKQIDFECYNLVERRCSDNTPASLVLRNRQTRSSVISEWDGRVFVVTNPRWISPDLAIICVHLDENNNLDSDSLPMVEFADRHGIPSILIRMDRGWQGNYGTAVKTDYLHESIQSNPELPPGQALTSNLPVDIPAFLNLDSALLNKHIAYLISLSATSRSYEDSQVVSLPAAPHEEQSSFLTPISPAYGYYLKRILITLWIVGVYFFLGAQRWPLALESLSSRSASMKSAVDIPNSAVSARASEAPNVSQTHLPDQISNTLSHAAWKLGPTNQLLAIPSTSPAPTLGEENRHFQISIIGESQLMVRLPRIFLSRKKRSQLEVVLMKGNRTIPAVVQELFDGVYSIQLQPRDASGDVEVNLTLTKPPLSESLTLFLGSQTTNDYRPLQTVLHAINGTLQGAINQLSTWLPDWRSKIPSQILDSDVGKLKDLKESIKGLRITYVTSKRSTLKRLSVLQTQGLTGAKSLHADMTCLMEEGVVQGRRILRHLTDGIHNAQAGLLGLFKSVDAAQLSAELRAGILAKKLGVAQGSARHIVSNAAGKLRNRERRD
ncbi:hypothetical protein A1O3_05169 [Capronia epimyces CBS 606.96]|uniref:Uncharacterized protein n=1 Tax=Capronia epimyces CBS 606.96 TaxID=1182542 RepID=W9Y4D5_9EURO|nr:uncharacterized protein A1O3_05169 [Capronia epimyces CBS 606.96]EXJ84500.1 hypothetical protein A1O3_05169 [Capronia epimyces CBS 606.96]